MKDSSIATANKKNNTPSNTLCWRVKANFFLGFWPSAGFASFLVLAIYKRLSPRKNINFSGKHC